MVAPNSWWHPARGSLGTLPKLGILGHGQAGKGTMSEWLAAHTSFRYPGSSSQFLLYDVVAARHNITAEEAKTPAWRPVCAEAFATRHQHRLEWKRVAHEKRDGDHLYYVNQLVALGDVVDGLRDIREIVAARAAGVIDCFVWVENPRVPPDPTVDFEASDCDVSIINDDTYDAFYGRIAAFCRFGRIPVYTTSQAQ